MRRMNSQFKAKLLYENGHDNIFHFETFKLCIWELDPMPSLVKHKILVQIIINQPKFSIVLSSRWRAHGCFTTCSLLGTWLLSKLNKKPKLSVFSFVTIWHWMCHNKWTVQLTKSEALNVNELRLKRGGREHWNLRRNAIKRKEIDTGDVMEKCLVQHEREMNRAADVDE